MFLTFRRKPASLFLTYKHQVVTTVWQQAQNHKSQDFKNTASYARKLVKNTFSCRLVVAIKLSRLPCYYILLQNCPTPDEIACLFAHSSSCRKLAMVLHTCKSLFFFQTLVQKELTWPFYLSCQIRWEFCCFCRDFWRKFFTTTITLIKGTKMAANNNLDLMSVVHMARGGVGILVSWGLPDVTDIDEYKRDSLFEK